MRNYNYNYLKNKSWDAEIIRLIGQIHEHKGKQDLYLKQKPDQLEQLIEIAKIQSTEASNSIEGIRTTNTRLKKLVSEKTTPINRDEEEIMGYRDVLNIIHENYEYIPVRSSYILQLHKNLYTYSAKSIGGHFKNTQNYISAIDGEGESYVLFTPVDPFETPMAVESICDSYEKMIQEQDVDVLLLIPVFIHDFLCIHPFNDGNGRMSRLLTTLLLYKSGYAIAKYISIEKIIAKTKDEYYLTLQECQTGWKENKEDPTPFIKYLLKVILSAYKEFESRIDMIGKSLSAYEIVQNAVNQKIGKFTKTEILEMCPTIKKASVENSIKRLVDEGKLEKHGAGKNTFYVCKF